MAKEFVTKADLLAAQRKRRIEQIREQLLHLGNELWLLTKPTQEELDGLYDDTRLNSHIYVDMLIGPDDSDKSGYSGDKIFICLEILDEREEQK